MKKQKENKVEEIKKTKSVENAKILNIRFNILAIVCIILFCAVLTPITFQNDTFYSIKIGEHILNNGIDMQDPFSWHEGIPYVYPHWLYDTLTYLIYSFSGFMGLFITTMILSCVLGITMYFVNKKISKNKLVAFIITLITMYLLKDFITARAQLVTFILFELEILLIEKFLDKKKIIYVIFLALISLFMANLHCAVWPFFFILFMPYIAEYLLSFNYFDIYYRIKCRKVSKKIAKCKDEEKAKKLENKLNSLKVDKEKIVNKIENRRKNPYKLRIEKRDAAKWLILIMVVCALMGFIAPNGDTPFTYLIKTMQGNTTESISEHLPLTLINNIPLMIVLGTSIALLVLTDVKITLRDIFMFGGLVILMFMSRRQQSMFLIMGSAIFAKWIAELVSKYDKDGTKEFVNIMLSTLGMIATLSVVALFMVLSIKEKVGDRFVNEKFYPTEAVEYIKENLDLDKVKLYNEYNYGSYLLFNDIPVFIDSRAELYAPEYNKTEKNPDGLDIFSDYINTSNISKYYEDTFKKYNMTHAIMYKKSKLNMLLSRDNSGKYEEIYSDDYFVIYKLNLN